jgi:hypothetical protein
VSIFPFTLGAADPVKSRKKGFDQVQLKFGVDQGSNRLPEHLTNFDSMRNLIFHGVQSSLDADDYAEASTITQPIFEDPNKVLVKAIADQNIVSFVRLDLTTSSKVNPQPKNPITANDGIVGGGTANIGFLQGSDDIFTKDSPPHRVASDQPTSTYGLGLDWSLRKEPSDWSGRTDKVRLVRLVKRLVV